MSDGLDQPRLGVNEEPEEERREDVWEDPEREDERRARDRARARGPSPRARARGGGSPGRGGRAPALRRAEHAAGDLQIPDGYGVIEGEPTGNRRAVGIVVARFNGELTGELLRRALDELERLGVGREAVTVIPVPGAFELPLAAMALAKTRRYSCIVALGAVIRGETPHFEYVASEAASGLQLAGPRDRRAGRLRRAHVENEEQARARARQGLRGGAHGARDGRRLLAAARGRGVRLAAVATLLRRCPRSAQSAGRSPASATTGATRWWPRSGASTRTSSASASCSTARRRARTSARAASRATRSRRPSSPQPAARRRSNGPMAETALTIPSELGRITIAPEAIAQIVGRVAAECYGVVGMSLRAPLPARERVTRLLPKGKPVRGIVVRNVDGAVALELYVVIAYGLNLAEVAATVRSQVGYEVERLTGLRVASVDVHIQNVKRTGMSELETVRRLAHGALDGARAEPGADRRPERLPGSRRRHGHEPDADGARGGGGARAPRRATDRPTLAREATRAALMSARGNSGVILSQIVRGAADSLAESDDSARAFRGASDEAYAAVRKPVEGTMLTVIRELAEAAEAARRSSRPSCSRCWSSAGRRRSRARREQLDVLREAGVVDAGGAGLVELVRGLAAAAAGEDVARARRRPRTHGSRPCTRSPRGTATARRSWSRARGSTRGRWSPSSSGSATRCSSSATRPR